MAARDGSGGDPGAGGQAGQPAPGAGVAAEPVARRINPSEFRGHGDLETAINAMMAQVDVPMNWNEWQSAVAGIGRLYGKDWEKGELRRMYSERQQLKFGDGWKEIRPARPYQRKV